MEVTTKLQNHNNVSNKVKIVEQGSAIWINSSACAPTWVKFSNGKVGIFDRVAKKTLDNKGYIVVDIDQCKEGEFIVPPCFIYRPINKNDSDYFRGLQHKVVADRFKSDILETEIDKDAPVEEVTFLKRGEDLIQVASVDEIKKNI